jgi:hypothetical protein
VEKREENQGKAVTWHVAMKRSKRKALPENKLGRRLEKLEHLKASVRAKVEHPFHVVKNLFRHRKVHYRGFTKKTAQLSTLFASPTWSWLAGASRYLKPELRLERVKARDAARIYRIKPIPRGADSEFRHLDEFACSKTEIGVEKVNCSAFP